MSAEQTRDLILIRFTGCVVSPPVVTKRCAELLNVLKKICESRIRLGARFDCPDFTSCSRRHLRTNEEHIPYRPPTQVQIESESA
jgi:hypothetical protein